MAALSIAWNNIRLVTRTKTALFFTFIFPLIFLFTYAGIFAGGNPMTVAYFFGPVVVLQVMGSAFWGLGLQSVMQRERGSLRRFRLAPIGAGDMVVSSLLSNYLLLLPTIALLLFCAMIIFHMPLTISLFDLLILVTIGSFAFAGFGLTIGSIANTMQEAQVYNNVVWFPLLFLSGATIPLPVLPHWLQEVAAFLPATYLVNAFQGVMSTSEPLSAYWPELAALLISGIFGLLFAWKLFRWEKEERIPRSNKFLAATFIVPFLIIGGWMNARGNVSSSFSKSYNLMTKPAASHKSSATAGQTAPAGSESGLVSDFDQGSASAQFGVGWQVSTDSMMGGKSTAQMGVVSGGAQGSPGSLLITGEIVPGSSYPWAGAMFMPGSKPFGPADLSNKKEISFWAKGDGKTYRIMLFSSDTGPVPAIKSFVAGPDWKPYTFPLASFAGSDPHQIAGLLLSGGPAPGKFRFQIDEVRFN
ncbi:MAG TPA: CIA30 family protein [Terriglobia bacterium]|nr:CIA30 family protein [Terriglobia bacterium]